MSHPQKYAGMGGIPRRNAFKTARGKVYLRSGNRRTGWGRGAADTSPTIGGLESVREEDEALLLPWTEGKNEEKDLNSAKSTIVLRYFPVIWLLFADGSRRTSPSIRRRVLVVPSFMTIDLRSVSSMKRIVGNSPSGCWIFFHVCVMIWRVPRIWLYPSRAEDTMGLWQAGTPGEGAFIVCFYLLRVCRVLCVACAFCRRMCCTKMHAWRVVHTSSVTLTYCCC